MPLFNEEGSVKELVERLAAAVSGFPGSSVVMVDDGSSDGGVARLECIARDIPRSTLRIRLRRLSRNFGLQRAVFAGLEESRADDLRAGLIFVIDGDLQDRPEDIPALLAAMDGFDVAFAVRSKRGESWAFRLFAGIFYQVLVRWSAIKVPANAGNFSVMRRVVAEQIVENADHNIFFPGLRAWVGFRQRGVPLERYARKDGESRMGIKRLVRLAIGALFAYSSLPLRVMFFLSGVALVSSVVLMVAIVGLKLAGLIEVQGIALLAVLILLSFGVVLTFLTILAFLVGRNPSPMQSQRMYVLLEPDRDLN
ncbi:MAG: glycosyltransferase [Proteobacteria bacterium]|nr:glycosyltransferase [Pseudomonadota bacterium]